MKLVKRLQFIIAMFLGMFFGYLFFGEDSEKIKEYNYYEENYQTKIGSTMMLNDDTDWLSYELRTFDGGKIWYAVESDINNGAVRILGESDSIYPGLIDHINGLDKLTEYVEKNVPLDLSESDSSEQIKLLEDIGIKIVINEKQDTIGEVIPNCN